MTETILPSRPNSDQLFATGRCPGQLHLHHGCHLLLPQVRFTFTSPTYIPACLETTIANSTIFETSLVSCVQESCADQTTPAENVAQVWHHVPLIRIRLDLTFITLPLFQIHSNSARLLQHLSRSHLCLLQPLDLRRLPPHRRNPPRLRPRTTPPRVFIKALT